MEVEKRLVDFIAPRHQTVYRYSTTDCDDNLELWHRAHLIVDYISWQVTDLFALKMHQMLGGTRL